MPSLIHRGELYTSPGNSESIQVVVHDYLEHSGWTLEVNYPWKHMVQTCPTDKLSLMAESQLGRPREVMKAAQECEGIPLSSDFGAVSTHPIFLDPLAANC